MLGFFIKLRYRIAKLKLPVIDASTKRTIQNIAIAAWMVSLTFTVSYWIPVIQACISGFILVLTWGNDARPKNDKENKQLYQGMSIWEITFFNIIFVVIGSCFIIAGHFVEGYFLFLLLYIFSMQSGRVNIRRKSFVLMDRDHFETGHRPLMHYWMSFVPGDYRQVFVQVTINGETKETYCLRPSIWEAIFARISYDEVIWHTATLLEQELLQNPNQTPLVMKGVIDATSALTDGAGEAGVP